MQVKDFMTPNPTTCTEDQTVEEAAQIMTDKGFSTMLIVDNDGKLTGILTESDFIGREQDIPHALASLKQLFGQSFYFSDVEPIYKKAKTRKLSEVMTRFPTKVAPDTELSSVIDYMVKKGFKRFPVVEGDKLVGIVTRKDIIKAFLAS